MKYSTEQTRKQELKLFCHLRRNARVTLTEISKKTGMPISTAYDKIKRHKGGLIKKMTALLDFHALGFSIRTVFFIKAHRNDTANLESHLLKSLSVNSVFRVNNGFNFMVEAIFEQLKDAEQFFNRLEEHFKVNKMQVFYLFDELRRESFMNDPDLIDVVCKSENKEGLGNKDQSQICKKP